MKMRCLFLFISAVAAGAQTPPVPSVRASGEGSVFAQPDCAKIDIGVVTQAPTAQAASSQNAGQLQSVLAKLHDILGQKAEIKTISYSLNPVYQYPKTGGKPAIDGYSASNVVEVTSGDLPNIGKVIDAATAGGANEIRSLQFTLKDDKAVRAAALRQAVLEAHANAQAMAGALGLKLGKLLLLEQSSAPPVRPMMAAMSARAAAPTPIETQPVEVRASVTLTMAVEQ